MLTLSQAAIRLCARYVDSTDFMAAIAAPLDDHRPEAAARYMANLLLDHVPVRGNIFRGGRIWYVRLMPKQRDWYSPDGGLTLLPLRSSYQEIPIQNIRITHAWYWHIRRELDDVFLGDYFKKNIWRHAPHNTGLRKRLSRRIERLQSFFIKIVVARRRLLDELSLSWRRSFDPCAAYYGMRFLEKPTSSPSWQYGRPDLTDMLTRKYGLSETDVDVMSDVIVIAPKGKVYQWHDLKEAGFYSHHDDAWKPVPRTRHPKVKSASKTQIVIGDLILMECPKKIYDIIREEDFQIANRPMEALRQFR